MRARFSDRGASPRTSEYANWSSSRASLKMLLMTRFYSPGLRKSTAAAPRRALPRVGSSTGSNPQHPSAQKNALARFFEQKDAEDYCQWRNQPAEERGGARRQLTSEGQGSKNVS